MFLLISWRWVVNVVAVIASTRIAATIITADVAVGAPGARLQKRLRERDLPEVSACAELLGLLLGEEARAPSPFLAAWSSSRNSAKKIGICSRIGRQDANGLVPASL